MAKTDDDSIKINVNSFLKSKKNSVQAKRNVEDFEIQN
jgi:hypothetical protein